MDVEMLMGGGRGGLVVPGADSPLPHYPRHQPYLGSGVNWAAARASWEAKSWCCSCPVHKTESKEEFEKRHPSCTFVFVTVITVIKL